MKFGVQFWADALKAMGSQYEDVSWWEVDYKYFDSLYMRYESEESFKAKP